MEAIGMKNNNPRYSSRPSIDENSNEFIIKTDIKKNGVFMLKGKIIEIIKVEDLEIQQVKGINNNEFNYSFRATANITYPQNNDYITDSYYLTGEVLIKDSRVYERTNILITPR